MTTVIVIVIALALGYFVGYMSCAMSVDLVHKDIFTQEEIDRCTTPEENVMPYKVKIEYPDGTKEETFSTIAEAAAWIEQENKGIKYPCLIERLREKEEQ